MKNYSIKNIFIIIACLSFSTCKPRRTASIVASAMGTSEVSCNDYDISQESIGEVDFGVSSNEFHSSDNAPLENYHSFPKFGEVYQTGSRRRTLFYPKDKMLTVMSDNSWVPLQTIFLDKFDPNLYTQLESEPLFNDVIVLRNGSRYWIFQVCDDQLLFPTYGGSIKSCASPVTTLERTFDQENPSFDVGKTPFVIAPDSLSYVREYGSTFNVIRGNFSLLFKQSNNNQNKDNDCDGMVIIVTK